MSLWTLVKMTALRSLDVTRAPLGVHAGNGRLCVRPGHTGNANLLFGDAANGEWAARWPRRPGAWAGTPNARGRMDVPRLVEEGTVPARKDVTGRAGDDEGECVTWSGRCSAN